MFWSMAPLVLACIVLAGMLGMCSFQASGPGRARRRPTTLRPRCRPTPTLSRSRSGCRELPEGWQSNSGSRNGIDGGRTDPASGQQVRAVSSTVGYLAPTGMYVSLTQSNADEDKLVGVDQRGRVPDRCRRTSTA